MSRYPSLPLSLSADYEALADIDLSPKGSSWRDALKGALASQQHQAFAAPPNDIDFAGLAANRLATQVSQQFTLASELVTILTGRFTDNPVVVNGTQSPAALLALDRAGFNELVLPESDLSVAPSSTLNWGAPFHVAGAPVLTALSTDGPLSSLVTDTAIEPGRRAALALATLAFMHYEAPYARATRTVVIEVPVGRAVQDIHR